MLLKKPSMKYKIYPILILSSTYGLDETPPDTCGLVTRSDSPPRYTCYTFVPPFDYDRDSSLLIRLIEYALEKVKAAPRASVYYAMRKAGTVAWGDVITAVGKADEKRNVKAYSCPGVKIDEDINYDDVCRFQILGLKEGDVIVKWSGRLNGVKRIAKDLMT